jgi:putative NADH-flavin reductase
MKIAIIGAGAGIGLETVNQALNKGYNVVALSTNINKLPDHAALTKIQGSASRQSDLKRVMVDSDAVLITVGTKNKKKVTLFSEIAQALITVGQELGYRNPVLIITGFGAGDSKPYLNLFMKTVIRLFLKDQYKDKSLMEQLIAASGLNWEIVRPGMLADGQATNSYQVLSELQKGMKVGKIGRADVAAYLISEAALKKNLQKYITLT